MFDEADERHAYPCHQFAFIVRGQRRGTYAESIGEPAPVFEILFCLMEGLQLLVLKEGLGRKTDTLLPPIVLQGDVI